VIKSLEHSINDKRKHFFASFAEDRDKQGVVQLTLEKFISKLFLTFAFQYGAFKSGKYHLPLKLPKLPEERKQAI
jgi:hypothetical protein